MSAVRSQGLGLRVGRVGRTPDAIAELSRAAELAPEIPRYAYVYGIALHSAGEVERARGVLDDAYRRHPGDRSLLTGLVTLSRDVGDLETALAYAVALVGLIPEDPGARQLLTEIRSSLSEKQ